MPGAPLTGLQSKLGYSFTDESILRSAVTHRSFSCEPNERLDLLGDAVLDLIVTQWLLAQFPSAAEGQLSRFRASLVRKEMLAACAREIALGDYLLMGQGELRSGGFDRDSTLSDAFEAVFGAIYLDGGLDETIRVLNPRFSKQLAALSLNKPQQDAKTRLQELLQGTGEPLPVYKVVSATGEAHAQRFTVECQCRGLAEPTTGHGTSRRIAEQEAGAAALQLLGNQSSQKAPGMSHE